MLTAFVERTEPELSELEWQLACARVPRSISPPPSLRVVDERATPEPIPIPRERWRLAAAEIRHLSAILRQVFELCNQPERDEYGRLRPTKHALDATSNLLVDAVIVAAAEPRQIPYGCVSTDAEGGVRIEWVRPATSVHLVVPATADQPGYIYHEGGQDYGTEPATPEALAHWLRTIN